jgi:hypothetical protein
MKGKGQAKKPAAATPKTKDKTKGGKQAKMAHRPK